RRLRPGERRHPEHGGRYGEKDELLSLRHGFRSLLHAGSPAGFPGSLRELSFDAVIVYDKFIPYTCQTRTPCRCGKKIQHRCSEQLSLSLCFFQRAALLARLRKTRGRPRDRFASSFRFKRVVRLTRSHEPLLSNSARSGDSPSS